MAGTVITVASGKGGVGKTTSAVNLAVSLWTEGNAVALVDADLGMANLAAVLGLEPEATLHDVLADRAELDEALIEAQDGDLLVLPGGPSLTGFAAADPDRLGEVVETLADRCRYVVVDTGAGVSYEDVLPLGLADEVVLVTTADPAAIGDTRKTRELAELVGVPVRGVIVTRVREGVDADAVAAELGVDLLGTIPEDAAVTESTVVGDPLASHAPNAPATAAYEAVAAAIGAGDAPAAVDETATADETRADATGSMAPAAAGDAETARAAPPETESPDGDEGVGPTEDGDAEPTEDGDAEPTEDEDAEPTEDGDAEPTEDGDAEPTEDGDAEPTEDGDAEPTEDDEVGAAETEEADTADERESTGAPEEADASEEPERRGGVTGWLGRLFS